jgi:dimethylhistidine N-methyltransferase
MRRGQKELPSKYLYDALGSRLFEAICELPEYGLTRADERVLRESAADIVDELPGDVIVCELGSGNGHKTRSILEALTSRGPTTYYPIEISPEALLECRRAVADIESVGIVGLEGEYIEGLVKVTARRKAGQRLLVLFLGRTIGNFSSPADVEFLRDIRSLLRPGDALLLGTDLLKPASQLALAYDDPLGVTAAFNLNLLARINRELDGDFDLRHFEHTARFNRDTSSVEMHLRSNRGQSVSIPKSRITVNFGEGETIWTENSRKYSLSEVDDMARQARFTIAGQWTDREWPFAESLLQVSPT